MPVFMSYEKFVSVLFHMRETFSRIQWPWEGASVSLIDIFLVKVGKVSLASV